MGDYVQVGFHKSDFGFHELQVTPPTQRTKNKVFEYSVHMLVANLMNC